jgi:hypothetical protein
MGLILLILQRNILIRGVFPFGTSVVYTVGEAFFRSYAVWS